MLKKIGDVTVDSGLLYLGDPLLELPDRNKVLQFNGRDQSGNGVMLATGGDGLYPAYRKVRDTGRISDRSLRRVIFDFTDEEVSNPNMTSVKTILCGSIALLLIALLGKQT